jgi:hypothetical protein
MNGLWIYLLTASFCIAVSYSFYLLFVSRKVSLRWMRKFLLLSLLFSMLLPLHSFQIRFSPAQGNQAVTSMDGKKADNKMAGSSLTTLPETQVKAVSGIQRPVPDREFVVRVFKYLYSIIAGILLVRLLASFLKIMVLMAQGRAVQEQEFVLIRSKKIAGSFSFFNWIFISESINNLEEIQNIIIHERIHAAQYHSFDSILVELLAAVMWFNPVIWFVKRNLQQVHEYLADEGTLDAGISKPVYQTLLLNQVAEDRLIVFSSGFNPARRPGRQSLLKKRIIMMTKPKLGQRANLRILTLVPLAALLSAGIACVNGQKKPQDNPMAVVAPTKMNVLYIGVDNPISIAVSGYESSQLRAEVDSMGRIEGENGMYVIRPIKPGLLKVSVFADDNLVAERFFRVKTVPDPVAMVAGKRGGDISREELLKTDRVEIVLENFDFDLKFVTAEFTVTILEPEGYIKEYKSNSALITEDQKKLIRQAKEGFPVYFKDIKAIGPDGSLRDMGQIVFNVH